VTLRIDQPGLCSTVQDLGRRGHGASGVGPAGAADPLSLRIGNRLIGNPESAAAIEMTLTGPTLTLQRDALVCLTGAPAFEARLEHDAHSRPLEAWTPTPVRAGSTITIGPLSAGCRAYLCIGGGIATEPVLGSRSVHLPTGIGGAALKHGDELPLGPRSRGIQIAKPAPDLVEQITSHLARRTLRLIPGAHHDRFTATAITAITDSSFTITDRSDRTGIRLVGSPIEAPTGAIRSEGVVTGTIQIPPGGEPIALLTDRPATGGYPVIGCIIGADLPALGQLRPRDRVRFEWTTRDRAHTLLRTQHALIESIPMPHPSPHARTPAP